MVLSILLMGCLPHTEAKLVSPFWYTSVEVITKDGVTKLIERRGQDWEPVLPIIGKDEIPKPGSNENILGIFLENNEGSYLFVVPVMKHWLSYRDKLGSCYTFYYTGSLIDQQRVVTNEELVQIDCP
jgi:hypothetical protein